MGIRLVLPLILAAVAFRGHVATAESSPAPAAGTAPPTGFYLHAGDSVVLFGDSITNQRLYTMDVETYVTTRFPKLKIHWIVAGQDGDSVDNNIRHGERLEREVISRNPTVMTIMLGMNDGWYKEFDQQMFERYVTGYEKLLKTVNAA
jgi:lysophospholipase L1-like esterase